MVDADGNIVDRPKSDAAPASSADQDEKPTSEPSDGSDGASTVSPSHAGPSLRDMARRDRQMAGNSARQAQAVFASTDDQG